MLHRTPDRLTGGRRCAATLSSFEIATCNVVGVEPNSPTSATRESPRRALEATIRPALEQGPCYVTFSGGRDSSAVLAVAVDLARREGLELPVPVTRLYPAYPDSDESEWQRVVIDHLGLTEWVRMTLHDEHDLLGEAARASLRRHGLLWTPQLQVHGHVYATLGPGSLLTGEGGDATLGIRRITPVTRILRRRTVTRDGLGRAVQSVLPRPLRRDSYLRMWQRIDRRPWLRPHVQTRLHELLADEFTDQPLRYDQAIRWVGRRRFWRRFEQDHARVAQTHGLLAINPLLDPRFLAALAWSGGPLGSTGRTADMLALFGDLLPSRLLTRPTKAGFEGVYGGEGTRTFGRDWDGSGVDPDLVDVDRLKSEWISPSPSTTTALLLQSAWLASLPARAMEPA